MIRRARDFPIAFLFIGLIGCQSFGFLGPMVQVGNTDGKTSIVIVWRTNDAGDSLVEYGLTAEYGLRAYDTNLTNYHEIVLHNLQPSRRYYYRVATSNKVLFSAVFDTGKTEFESFSFAVFGDSGSGDDHQQKVADRVKEINPDLILHTGDLIYYSGKDRKYFDQFYRPYRDLISRIPFFPSIGNHDFKSDFGQPLLDNFVLPGNERNYGFDYSNAHFVALDSNADFKNTAVWLDKDLAKTDKLWKIVFFHHPPPFVFRHAGDEKILKYWVPIFEKHKVDIVFNGHQHFYARSKIINGVRYIIEGCGGKRRYKFRKSDYWIFGDDEHWGFGSVTIFGGELKFQHISDEGMVLDSFTIVKK